MLLDRGELKDWFNSTEIWVEAIVSGVFFYLFIVHTATASDRSFINLDLLKSPNFMAGTVLMFFVGGILSGTLALLPTMLQSLMNYPVFTTGLVTAPRGIGTMIAMFVVGRMINRVDNRLIILTGFLLTVLSLWQMTGFSLQMGMAPVILSGVAAGFRPRLHLCAAEHARAVGPAAAHPDARDRDAQPDAQSRRQHRHLDPRGAADPEHADRPFAARRASAAGQPARPGAATWRRRSASPTPSGMAALNAEVTRQAAMVAYINDYALMMMIVLLLIPLLLLVRRARPALRGWVEQSERAIEFPTTSRANSIAAR